MFPTFTGQPSDIGQAMAARWGRDWRQVLVMWRRETARRDSVRVAQFRELLQTYAPHWLEEAAAFAGETLDDVLDFNSHEPSPPPVVQDGNCSSLVAVGNATADGQPLLLKIRDEAPWPQIAFRRRINNGPVVLGGANPGNLGFASFLNESGLAGINNTGGPILDTDLSVGLNDCHVLRLVAEQATNCDEALDLIRQFIARRALGLGGYRKGMIFFFADAKGRGLAIECSRQKLVHQFLEDGVVSRANDYRFSEMKLEMDASRHAHPWHVSSLTRSARLAALVESAGPLTPGILENISRDTAGEYPLCNATDRFPFRTVAAWILMLRRGAPQACRAMICMTAPTLGQYVTVPVSEV